MQNVESWKGGGCYEQRDGVFKENGAGTKAGPGRPPVRFGVPEGAPEADGCGDGPERRLPACNPGEVDGYSMIRILGVPFLWGGAAQRGAKMDGPSTIRQSFIFPFCPMMSVRDGKRPGCSVNWKSTEEELYEQGTGF